MSGKFATGNIKYLKQGRFFSALLRPGRFLSANKARSTPTIVSTGPLAGIRHDVNLFRNVLSIAMASPSTPPAGAPKSPPQGEEVTEAMIKDVDAKAQTFIKRLESKKTYWRTPVGGWKTKTLIYAASAAASAYLAIYSSTNIASLASLSLGAWESIALNGIAGIIGFGIAIHLIAKAVINLYRGRKLAGSKNILQKSVGNDRQRSALGRAISGWESTKNRNNILVIFADKRTQIENEMAVSGSVKYVADFRSALENGDDIDSDTYNDAEIDNRINSLKDIDNKLAVIRDLRQMKKDLKTIMNTVRYVKEYQEADDKENLDPNQYNPTVIDKKIAAIAALGDTIIVDEGADLVEALQAINEELKKSHLTAQEIKDAERISKIDFSAYENNEDDLAKAAGNLAALNPISAKMTKSTRKTAQEESLDERVLNAVSALGAKIDAIKEALKLVELEGRDGKYTLESPIGEGGMGYVWKGRKIGTDDFLAIKEMAVEKLIAGLRKRFKNDDAKVIEHAGQFLARFAQEFILGRVLQHDDLCATVDTNIDIVLPGIWGNGAISPEKIDDPKEFKEFYRRLEENIKGFLKRFSSRDLEKVKGKRIFMAIAFVPESPGSKERAPNLEEEIAKGKGGMSLARVRGLFKPLFEVLEYLHSFGVYHRDLKSANLVITQDEKGKDRLKVIDLGIAKVASPDEDMTSFKDVVGSKGYEAPSDYQTAGKLNNENYERSDIYSLAIVMIEALTGKNPDAELEEKSNRADYYTDREGFTTEFLQELGVPAELIPSLRKATSPKHADNYRSMKEFGEAFFAKTSAVADTAAASPAGKRKPKPVGPPPPRPGEKAEPKPEPVVKMPPVLDPLFAEPIDVAKLDEALDYYNTKGVVLSEEQEEKFDKRLTRLSKNKNVPEDTKEKIVQAKIIMLT